MKSVRHGAVAALLLFQVACGDGVGVEFTDLAGRWNAIRYEAMEEDTWETEDWIATGRMSGLTIDVTASGDAVVTVWLQGRAAPMTFAGALSRAGTEVTFHVNGGAVVGAVALDLNLLTVTMPSFPLNGEDYGLVMTLKR